MLLGRSTSKAQVDRFVLWLCAGRGSVGVGCRGGCRLRAAHRIRREDIEGLVRSDGDTMGAGVEFHFLVVAACVVERDDRRHRTAQIVRLAGAENFLFVVQDIVELKLVAAVVQRCIERGLVQIPTAFGRFESIVPGPQCVAGEAVSAAAIELDDPIRIVGQRLFVLGLQRERFVVDVVVDGRVDSVLDDRDAVRVTFLDFLGGFSSGQRDRETGGFPRIARSE